MDTAKQKRFLELRRKIIEEHFSNMNDMQKEAIYTVEGPLLILAGAGSGKTTVLINRIANMVLFGDAYNSDYIPQMQDEDLAFLEEYAAGDSWDSERAYSLIRTRPIQPYNILAITFTNKAAGELRERLEDTLGIQAQEINASTFHSACVRILRREIERIGYNSSFTIYDSDDSLRVIKLALKELNLDEKQFNARGILSVISRAKDALQSPQDFMETVGDDFRNQVAGKVYGIYQRNLRAANAVDFDDIITLTVKILKEHPEALERCRRRFRYIMVDEYQDTNRAQYELVWLLSGESGNLCVVGDDDQSIYKFRGATIENILNFERSFPQAKVIRLEQNYRSTTTILDAANAVISHNTQRKGKTLWTDNGQGDKVKVYRAASEDDEARFVCDTIQEHVSAGERYSDHVVLYRMNAQSQMLERGLVKAAIPYRIIGGLRFYERKEIKDIVAYLNVLSNPNDMLRLRRIINEPKRGIGDSTVTALERIVSSEGADVFDVLSHADQYVSLHRKAPALMQFASMMGALMEQVDQIPLDELLTQLLDDSGYLRMLQEQGFEGQGRIENIEELKSSMNRYEQENEESSLTGFLEEISLYTDLDQYDPAADHVVLMTMHSAKGLEFPYVFVAGAEEGIFPGVQSFSDPAQIEEERRLAYVSLTRAKKQLYVLSAAQRMLFGQTMRNRPSRFVGEIPQDLCDVQDMTVSRYQTSSATIPAYAGRKGAAGGGVGVGGRPAAPAQPFDIQLGDAVTHKVFGDGMVLSITPMGNDHLVEIAFEKVGTKKVMAKFANLRKKV